MIAKLFGLALAFGLPAAALLASHLGHDLTTWDAAVSLAVTPWLVLAWTKFAERQPLSSIGVRPLTRATTLYGLLGLAINVGISIVVGGLSARLGIQETESGFAQQLVAGGRGWELVVFAASGALMTEIGFRGYALTRLTDLLNSRGWAAVIQVVLTTALFLVSRPGHALVWVVDDIVFTAYYFWRRDTVACVIAHVVPNTLAATLVALKLVQ